MRDARFSVAGHHLGTPVIAAVNRHLPGSASLATSIVAIVAHARDVPSETREALGAALAVRVSDPRQLLVRTCHRVELYVVGDDAPSLDGLDLPAGTTRYDDADAVRHLIAVACGLDSAIFGETQILHQLRETLETRRGEGELDPALDRLIQSALRAGREARTYFTGAPRSLGDAALDHIEAAVGSVRDREVLVMGAGRMGRLAAFAARRRGARIRIASRTRERAATLAAEIGATSADLDRAMAEAPPVGVVAALAGHWDVPDEHLDQAVAAGTVVVDLSSPPSLPEAQRQRLGDRLVSVDDLATMDQDGPDARLRLRLERLISRAGGDFCHWLRARESVPAIAAVVNNAEARRAEELAWLRRRLPELSDEELAVVEQMSHRLVAALLHAPLSALTGDDDGQLEPAARALFGI
jgi:glutamyl-tRNA reductase